MRQITDEHELNGIIELIPSALLTDARPWNLISAEMHKFRCDFDYLFLQHLPSMSHFTEYLQRIEEDRCYLVVCDPELRKRDGNGGYPAFEFLKTDTVDDMFKANGTELDRVFDYWTTGTEFVIVSESRSWLAFASFEERMASFSCYDSELYDFFLVILALSISENVRRVTG